MTTEFNLDKNEGQGKTTFTFRISPENKLQIAATAKGLGMSPSQYMEALALKRHGETINNLVEQKTASRFKFSKQLFNKIDEFLPQLRKKHSGFSDEEIMAACLEQAWSNQGAIWQRSLNTFLNRLRNYLSNQ